MSQNILGNPAVLPLPKHQTKTLPSKLEFLYAIHESKGLTTSYKIFYFSLKLILSSNNNS